MKWIFFTLAISGFIVEAQQVSDHGCTVEGTIKADYAEFVKCVEKVRFQKNVKFIHGLLKELIV